MPGPMNPTNFSFNSGTPGGGAQTSGYNYALGQLQNALGASNNTTKAGQMQLGQQLQANESGVQQNLASRGLGNTTVSQTMAQAPQQTYNLGMAQLGDLSAQRQMGAYGNLANAAMQGGNAISGLAQPYAQTNFAQQKMAQLAGNRPTYSPQMPSDFQQGQGAAQQGAAQQNAANMGQYNQTLQQLLAQQQSQANGNNFAAPQQQNPGLPLNQNVAPQGTPQTMQLPSGTYGYQGSSLPNIQQLMAAGQMLDGSSDISGISSADLFGGF